MNELTPERRGGRLQRLLGRLDHVASEAWLMVEMGWRRVSYRQIVKSFEANEDARAEANLLRLLIVGTDLTSQLRVTQTARGGTTVSVKVVAP